MGLIVQSTSVLWTYWSVRPAGGAEGVTSISCQVQCGAGSGCWLDSSSPSPGYGSSLWSSWSGLQGAVVERTVPGWGTSRSHVCCLSDDAVLLSSSGSDSDRRWSEFALLRCAAMKAVMKMELCLLLLSPPMLLRSGS
ncbi:hypothetical protein ILYODFUR_015888 [Ilyodon furcidens]|uniref:Secreted protein n=1 Tax=Ilyodon furcidens TaxID=33524 RepID=A0ABV0SLI4_9TELE